MRYSENSRLYPLYPNAPRTSFDQYVTISEHGNIMYLQTGAGSICAIDVIDKKIVYKKDNLSSAERKYIADFKKFLADRDYFVDKTYCLRINGDLIEINSSRRYLRQKMYEIMEDMIWNDEPVDMKTCGIYCVFVLHTLDGHEEYLWEDEYKYFTFDNLTVEEFLNMAEWERSHNYNV